MAFDVGDKVVYPHHGAATIEKREKKEAFGEKRDYLVLRLAYGDLTLMVPADNAEEIGLRDVINDEEVEEVFAVLRKKEARMPTNWSRRFKNHVEKLKSGDIYQVAEVVRNLSIREADKGLSAGEKRMLARARQILVSELTFALNVDEEAAEARLDAVLRAQAKKRGLDYVKLARIRLKDLNRQLAQRVSDDRQALEARLERADELAESNPPGARKIFAGIVALYDDKPWARELVARARAGLVQLDSARAAVEN